MKIRSAASFAIHEFFQKEGFYHVTTPIITSNDCEGAGEMFEVTPTEFFNRKAYLTVSGQLQGEIFACSLGRIYTFGPTFRAEKSHTTRHLAEFWMVEPEAVGYDLIQTYKLGEQLIKFTTEQIVNRCKNEMDVLWKGNLAHLEPILTSDWKAITFHQAKKILNSTDYSNLSTEEEKYLTVIPTQDNHFKAPLIITHYPASIKPFYMRAEQDHAHCFDLLLPGIGEVIGGSEREHRLPELQNKLKGTDTEAIQWYLDLRKYGTVPHSGFGMGFERLLMFLTGLSNVRDVVPIPITHKHLTC
jgi:asparaginyl-tRNA synthetase